MYDHEIMAMTNALVHSGVVPVDKQADAEAVLRQHWAGKIAHVWCIDDVKGERPDLTEEQCKEVLEQVLHDVDAEVGITWAVIRDTAKEMYGEDEELNPDAICTDCGGHKVTSAGVCRYCGSTSFQAG